MAVRNVQQKVLLWDDFLRGYRTATKRGMTAQELADHLETKVSNIYMKVQQLRKLKIPHQPLKRAGWGGVSINVQRSKDILSGKIK